MRHLIQAFIGWPARVAAHLEWLGPLLARIVVGWVFLLSGWGKLHNLPLVTANFVDWGIPFPQLLTPFVSGVEFFGGLFLILGFLTRISAGALAVVMLVAIRSALWDQVDSLGTLFGFDESAYFVVFVWLAAAGAGAVSVDRLLEPFTASRRADAAVRAAAAKSLPADA
jgi:putative oxidoreductase